MRLLLPRIQDLYHSSSIRPVTGKMRRQIFDVLPPASNVLDLFGGSGILGLEALARGASHLTYVDNNPNACKALRNYITHSPFAALSTEIICAKTSTITLNRKYDLIFIDPPYNQNLLAPTLEQLSTSEMITSQSIIVTKASKFEILNTKSFIPIRTTLYGESCVTIWNLSNN